MLNTNNDCDAIAEIVQFVEVQPSSQLTRADPCTGLVRQTNRCCNLWFFIYHHKIKRLDNDARHRSKGIYQQLQIKKNTNEKNNLLATRKMSFLVKCYLSDVGCVRRTKKLSHIIIACSNLYCSTGIDEWFKKKKKKKLACHCRNRYISSRTQHFHTLIKLFLPHWCRFPIGKFWEKRQRDREGGSEWEKEIYHSAWFRFFESKAWPIRKLIESFASRFIFFFSFSFLVLLWAIIFIDRRKIYIIFGWFSACLFFSPYINRYWPILMRLYAWPA